MEEEKVLEEREKEVFGGTESIVEDKSAEVLVRRDVLEERKNKIKGYFKKNYNWIIYIILAIIAYISVKIRTRNLAGLRDVTTGQWTLGPDLDPFLFLRWTKTIIAEGFLPLMDNMRYVPLGFRTDSELRLLPYLMAWFHKIAEIFGSTSVEQSSALFPVFMFVITILAFFLFVREIFVKKLGMKNSGIVALVASFFLTVLPPLLPRTIAGIPEKESAAFFFLFIAFYLFLHAWNSKGSRKKYIFGLLAGIATAGMALVWGAFLLIFFTIGISIFISYLLGHIDKEKIYLILIWMISSFALMIPFSTRYTIPVLAKSTMTLIILFTVASFFVEKIIFKTKLNKYFNGKVISNIPPKIVSMLTTFLIGVVIMSIFLGVGFIFEQINSIIQPLVRPISDRFGVTVAENRQPFFSEWSSNFGPIVQGFPLFFWLTFIGSIYLFNKMMKKVLSNKERLFLVVGYIILLSSMVFGRISPTSALNGSNTLSFLVYLGGVLIFVYILGKYYLRSHKSGELERFKKIDSNIVFLFVFFILGIIGARGSVRTIMLLAPPAAAVVSFFVVDSFINMKEKYAKGSSKLVMGSLMVLILIVTIFTGFQLYKISDNTARSFVPSVYTQQWQYAMSWVRENTPEDAVFGHWWDYGYWVQTIGERATILDGGNSIGYWNHLMGRYSLTGTSSRESAEFLYVHNATHFLIDSTDIGKYTAFSSIGSDSNFDRRSWINTFSRDDSRVQQTKNGTVSLYAGGAILDEDIVYEYEDGTNVFLPGVGGAPLNNYGNIAGIGGIRIEVDDSGKASQAVGIFVYQGQQYEIPFRYLFYDGEFIDFGTGVESGAFVFPLVTQNGQGLSVDNSGALLYLNKRVVKSQLARLYLYGEEDEFFTLAHSQKDSVIDNLEGQGLELGDFIHFQGFRGPIKIWEVNYPSDIIYKGEFLNTPYPEELLNS